MDARKSAQSILFVAAQIAARAGRVHHLADLMERGFNMNQLASDGSLLHAAVRARTSTSVSYLLEVGCNADARDRVARTPLHYAARNNDTACVELLLRAGATRWLTDVDGSTALDLAVKSESTGVVRQLLATGVTHAAPMQTCWF
jgi:ankyrin repeat protein